MKTSVLNRVLAKVIDLLIVFLIAAVLPTLIGPLIGFGYSLLCDGFTWGPFKGQSIGKKLMGLQTVSTVSESSKISFKESAIRNSPVGCATFFAIIPVWGWVILFLVGLPLMLIEITLMIRVDSGQRLGDVMADTEIRQIEPPFSFLNKGLNKGKSDG